MIVKILLLSAVIFISLSAATNLGNSTGCDDIPTVQRLATIEQTTEAPLGPIGISFVEALKLEDPGDLRFVRSAVEKLSRVLCASRPCDPKNVKEQATELLRKLLNASKDETDPELKAISAENEIDDFLYKLISAPYGSYKGDRYGKKHFLKILKEWPNR